MNKFAERLKALRIENNLTQIQLAKSLKIDQTYISKWELGKRIPNIYSIIAICNYFKVSSDYLIGLTD